MKTITVVSVFAVMAAFALVTPGLANDDFGSPAPMGEGIPGMESPAPLDDPPLPEPTKRPVKKTVIETESVEIEINSPAPMGDSPVPAAVVDAGSESPAPFESDEPSVLPGTIDIGNGVIDTVVEHEEVRVEYRGRGRPDKSGYTPLVRKTLYRGKKAPTLRHVRARLQSAGISTAAFDRKLAQFREEWRKQVRLNRSAIRKLRTDMEDVQSVNTQQSESILELQDSVAAIKKEITPEADPGFLTRLARWLFSAEAFGTLIIVLIVVLLVVLITAPMARRRGYFR